MLTKDRFTYIAERYSKTEIKTNEDVDKFFDTIDKNFSEEKVEEIITELTWLMYNDPPPGYSDSREYPGNDEYPQDDEGVVWEGTLSVAQQSIFKRTWAWIISRINW